MHVRHVDQLAMAALVVCSGGALALALIAQYGFDLWPCVVCYWQRVPYGLILFVGLLALLPAVDGPSRRVILWLCAGLFAVNVGLAGYHVGIEERWWKGPAECAGQVRDYSAADMLTALSQPGRLGCEEAAYRLLGLSMAGYNVIVCLVLAVTSAWAARQAQWWTERS
jgi:disulfide bond formation protein DsbB